MAYQLHITASDDPPREEQVYLCETIDDAVVLVSDLIAAEELTANGAPINFGYSISEV